MKGQSKNIHNPGLKIQGNLSDAYMKSIASNISSFLFIFSYS